MKRIFWLLLAQCWLLFVSLPARAELTELTTVTLTDSEESFDRRIYSYDFDVDTQGMVHVVYSKPVPGEDRAQIIYARKAANGQWPTEAERKVLEEYGKRDSISTHLITDDQGVVHISYIVHRDFVDQYGLTHGDGLVYTELQDGEVIKTANVSSGAFNSIMQLDENNQAIFAREYEIFVSEDGATLLQPPYARALRIQLPREDGTWTDRDYILSLPQAEYYRLADFVYDKARQQYHITWGNKNAPTLAQTYPTTNPPATSGVYFPPGSGHQLWYATSTDLKNWQASVIDDSGNLSENEFWTDLLVDSNGQPYAGAYNYATNANGVHSGSSNYIATLSAEDGAWHKTAIAGQSTGASAHRAGMGIKLIKTADGAFHGLWDNSPDAPIDVESSRGATMYRYSPDGTHWATRQMVLNLSAEGKIHAKIMNNRLYFLLLADYSDARLVYSEYQLPGAEDVVYEISSDKMFYGVGDPVQLHARMQKGKAPMSDIYLIVAGPYDAIGSSLQQTTHTAIKYLSSDFAWTAIDQLNDAKPVISGFPAVDFSGYFTNLPAQQSEPFLYPARYRIYSYVLQSGTSLNIYNSENMLAPAYTNDIHICSKANCAEIR